MLLDVRSPTSKGYVIWSKETKEATPLFTSSIKTTRLRDQREPLEKTIQSVPSRSLMMKTEKTMMDSVESRERDTVAISSSQKSCLIIVESSNLNHPTDKTNTRWLRASFRILEIPLPRRKTRMMKIVSLKSLNMRTAFWRRNSNAYRRVTHVKVAYKLSSLVTSARVFPWIPMGWTDLEGLLKSQVLKGLAATSQIRIIPQAQTCLARDVSGFRMKSRN